VPLCTPPDKPDKYLTDSALPMTSLTCDKGGVTVETPREPEVEPVARLDFGSYGLQWVRFLTVPTPKRPTR